MWSKKTVLWFLSSWFSISGGWLSYYSYVGSMLISWFSMQWTEHKEFFCCYLMSKDQKPSSWGLQSAPLRFRIWLLSEFLVWVKKILSLVVSRLPALGLRLMLDTLRLGSRCRVGSCRQSINDRRSRFRDFLHRDLSVLWLLSHQLVVYTLHADPKYYCRWGRLFPSRSSFFYVIWLLFPSLSKHNICVGQYLKGQVYPLVIKYKLTYM
jgi:hypothetical protein